jgi:hypothetical protein
LSARPIVRRSPFSVLRRDRVRRCRSVS